MALSLTYIFCSNWPISGEEGFADLNLSVTLIYSSLVFTEVQVLVSVCPWFPWKIVENQEIGKLSGYGVPMIVTGNLGNTEARTSTLRNSQELPGKICEKPRNGQTGWSLHISLFSTIVTGIPGNTEAWTRTPRNSQEFSDWIRLVTHSGLQTTKPFCRYKCHEMNRPNHIW